jgi:mRNA interferase HigB
VRVIALPPLVEFWEKHSEAEGSLKAWIAHVRHAEWKTPNEFREDFPNASLLGNNRVVFNIHGNHYRLVVAVLYGAQAVLIKFIGTHSEYDHTDVETVEII